MFKEVDGRFYRMRRGKLVEIPRKWLHCVPSNATMKDRREAAMMKRLGRKTGKSGGPSFRKHVIPQWDINEELAGE